MKIKKIAGFLHLWLGLMCGLVVVVSMTAASLFAWEAELTRWYYHDALYVTEKGPHVLPFEILYQNAQKALPGKPLQGMDLHNSGSESYEFYAYQSCDSCPGWFQWKENEYWYNIHVNQYTGKVTEVMDMRYNWIALTRYLHQNLLLRYEVGHYVVGFSTLIVLLLVLTGLVLWFPRNKAALKQRFTIKFSARWRRVNYDVHNVGGFYSWLVIGLLATTGLVWTFNWWENGIYRLLGSSPEQVYESHTPFTTADTLHASAMDKMIASFPELRPTWTRVFFNIPASQKDSVSEISAYLSFDGQSGWDEMDEYHFHPVTGKLLSSSLHEKKTVAAKWRHSNYAIHVGSIYGLPTKIAASAFTLFLASLPVTGFCIWWGRKKKSRQLPAKSGPNKPQKIVMKGVQVKRS